MNRIAARRSSHPFVHAECLEPRRLLSGSGGQTDAPLDPAGSAITMTQAAQASRQVSLTLSAFTGSVKVGSNFYASVTADAGTPKGLVYFYANGQPIGAGWVVDGQAWMHTKHLPAGTHSVYAVYAGDADHDRAASNEIAHIVSATSGTLAKASFGRWDWQGNGVTHVVGLYAPGAAVVPTGTLSFHDKPGIGASTWSVTATLDAHGRADFGMIDPPDDLQYLYYTYSGDANYPAESNLIFIPTPYTKASPAATGIALSVHKSATNPGEALTIKAVLQRPAAQTLSAAYAGTVQFWHEDMYLGSATVDSTGVATFVATGIETGGNHVITSEGLHTIRAVYTGDATHAAAEAQIWHAVIPSAKLTRVTLEADKLTAGRDEPITFTAKVTDVFDNAAGDQLGWVRLLDEWGKDITKAVRVGADGTATFVLHGEPADTHTLRAVYQGTMNHDGYTPGKSTSVTITITAGTRSARPGIVAKLTSVGTDRFPANLVVTLTRSGIPMPSGKVAIYSEGDASLFLGYANIDGTGTATMAFEPGLSKFYQKVRIIYLGDAFYAPIETTISLTPTYGYLDDKSPAGLPAAAKLAFAADVDGDGIKDLVYRNQETGGVIVRLMDASGAAIGIRNLPAASLANWALDAGGDIDGDGDADLIWRNLATSRAYVWTLQNGGLQSQGYINSGGTAAGWRVVAAGDFNNDGKDDIVWSNDLTGQRAVWLMNGRNVRGFTMFNHAPRDTAWIIESIEDLDADGDLDLLWHNTKTGASYGWLLTGTAVTGSIAPI